MKAAVILVLGQAPQYQDFQEPAVQDNEILVEVRAAGLHPIVKSIASGAHYSAKGEVPMIAGIDGVGTRADGVRVYFGGARKPWGTMAERCAVPVSMCLPLPDGIGDVQAAAIANPGMSAWLSLQDRAALATGETVLILALPVLLASWPFRRRGTWVLAGSLPRGAMSKPWPRRMSKIGRAHV